MMASKGLVLGILGALAAGGLEVAAETAIGAARDAATTVATSLTIPVGRIGDRVAYINYVEGEDTDNWLRLGTLRWTVGPLESRLDRWGVPHDVVLWLDNGSFYDAGGAIVREWSDEMHVTESIAVDLATREVLGGRQDITNNLTTAFGTNKVHDRRAVNWFGPWGSATLPEPDFFQKAYPFALQGRTLRTGETANDLAKLRLQVLNPHNLGSVSVHDVDYASAVTGPAELDGRTVVGLRMEASLRLEATTPSFWVINPNRVPLFDIPVPVPSTLSFVHTEWYADDVPFSVLEETQIWVNGSREPLKAIQSLASYEPGTRAIPWAEGPAATAPRERADLERSPASQTFPADGTGHGFSYTLAAAHSAVTADPTLVGFVRWRSIHPDATLVGAHLLPTGPDGHGRAWTLLFGAKPDQGFLLHTERVRPDAAAVHSALGELTITPLPGTLHGGPITFGAARQLWTEFVDPDGTKPAPNAAGWGYFANGPRIICPTIDPTPARCLPQPGRGVRWEDDVARLWVAYEDQPRQHGPSSAQMGPVRLPALFFQGSAIDGTAFMSRDFGRAYVVDPLPIPERHEAPVPKPVASPTPTTDAPNFASAALVSGSIFAAFLAYYFFPLLKFLAAQALLWIPGYAKIHKAALLNNKVRETIVQAVRNDPGITPPELQRITGVGWSTVVYHLGVLERNKILSSLLDGRHKRFFPVDDFAWGARGRFAALKNPRTRAVYDLLLLRPGAGPDLLAKHIGVSRPAVYFHVERLQKAGLVGEDRERGRVQYYANPQEPSPGAPEVA